MSRQNISGCKYLMQLALLGMCGMAAVAYADATLVYETVDAEGAKTQHTFAISGRFVRVDMDTGPNRYWVIDTGLLTLADVDTAAQRYTFEKLPRPELPATKAARQKAAAASAAEPATEAADTGPVLAPEPVLAPTRKKHNIAGTICRVVNEIAGDQPVAEHCMAGTGPLGITSREMVTLSRLFTTARRLKLGWAGVATADERIASVGSKLADGRGSQTLLSVSHEWIPDERMQVSKQYKRVNSLTAGSEGAEDKTQSPKSELPAGTKP